MISLYYFLLDFKKMFLFAKFLEKGSYICTLVDWICIMFGVRAV